jgi:hypothetical protein
MKRAEKMVRRQIQDLTMDRVATKKAEIEQAIKFFYWQGTFRERKYQEMKQVLNDKYTEIMNEYEQKLIQQCDADFEQLLTVCGLQKCDDYMS